MKQLRCTASSLVIRTTPGGTDTGKRVLKGQVVQAHGESFDKAWLFVVGAAGTGWSSAAYFEPVLPTAPSALVVIGREAWGAKHGQGDTMTGAKKLVVAHHFASPNVSPTATTTQERNALLGVEKHHVETNGWKGIGYGFVIMPSGRIYEGRGWARVGAHADGVNSKSVGVAFAIDGENHKLTDASVRAFRALTAEGIRRGFIASDYELKGHRDVNTDTRCPGDLVYSQLPTLR